VSLIRAVVCASLGIGIELGISQRQSGRVSLSVISEREEQVAHVLAGSLIYNRFTQIV
jgi:hypothetical protein